MKVLTNKESIGCSVMALMMSAGAYPQKLPDKPNILVIMTDQQTAGTLSFNLGHKYMNTPNMDWLAEHGVSFTNAYCAGPICLPSRSSMFTGRYPHELNITGDKGENVNPADFPTLGTLFRNAGYETGYFGKWHLPYNEKDMEVHGFLKMELLKHFGVDSLLPGAAIKFLETKRSSPFFAVVSFCNPHNICEWTRGDKLPDGPVGKAPPGEMCPPLRTNHLPPENETDIMQLMRRSYQASRTFPVSGFNDEKWSQYEWAYYRMTEKVDHEIGKIINYIRQSELINNTIIVFLSDHGDCQGAHLWNQKSVFYEEAVKVPFIVSYKGLKAGHSELLVNTGTDLMPSLCDFAGIQPPVKSPGSSLKQIIEKGSSSFKRDYVVVACKMIEGESVDGYKPEPEGRMLRNKRFKYWIYDMGKKRESLFDLQSDPGEMVNLAEDLKFRNDLDNCRSQLIEWAKKYNDPFLKNLVK